MKGLRWLDIKLFFHSLFRGMKSADDIMTTSNKEIESGGIVEEQKVESNSVLVQLLRGEITQEVKDVRYEMYESVRKSKDYKALGYTGKAVKKNHMLDKTPMKIDEEDGLKVILIQENKIELDGPDTAIAQSENISKVRVEADAKHRFKVIHEYPVRHKIETYAKKVVVKVTDVENQYKLDIYLSEYPIENDPRAVYVTKELESLYKSGSRTSDLTDILTLTFTTDKAWGDDDWKIYDFTIKQYLGIKKFDGNYILSFYASLPESGVFDCVDEYKDEESVRKFNEKEPRKKKNSKISLFNAIDSVNSEENKIDEEKANAVIKKVTKKKDNYNKSEK